MRGDAIVETVDELEASLLEVHDVGVGKDPVDVHLFILYGARQKHSSLTSPTEEVGGLTSNGRCAHRLIVARPLTWSWRSDRANRTNAGTVDANCERDVIERYGCCRDVEQGVLVINERLFCCHAVIAPVIT